MSAAEETQEAPEVPSVDETGDDVETPDTTEPEREDDDVDGPADDDVAPDETEAEYVAPEPPGLSQKEIDARVTKLERASNTYTRKVAEILGEDLADFVPSPLSLPFLFGFVFDPANVELPGEVLDATRRLIGEPVPPPLIQAPDARVCPTCDGWGQVLTGSKVHPFNVAKCIECQGRGWVGERANITPAEVAALHSVAIPQENAPPTPDDELDSWGTPRGHPDFGKMPQYRDPGWSEALEAYKRGEPAPVG